MNVAFGARTNWGKSWTASAYVEANVSEFNRLILVDYKDEYSGLVEHFDDVGRVEIDRSTAAVSPAKWLQILEGRPGIQLARTGATDEAWRVVVARMAAGLSELDETALVVIDEAHRVAPQQDSYPDPIDTLATTWHGDGIGVLWVTQRWALFDETILSQANASMLGGFGSGGDLDKVASIVEYPKEVHKADADRVGSRSLPDELLVDGEPLTLRRFTDEGGFTVGSEWIYSDDTDLRRIDTRDWSLESEHYGSDRKRIRHPFE